jgi:ornithine cyclodeaminase/alanine dehydrogenase-like protein (mu-crystallin family)
MLVLSAADLRAALPMAEAIAAMKRAFASLSDGRAQVPLRSHVVVPRHDGESLFMPAFVEDEAVEALTVKIVSVFPHNPQHGLPTLHAAVVVLDPRTGRPTALLEGGMLTAIRTGAASGAATDLLARPESHVAAIFGAGVQARTQLEAICTVRQLRTVWIYDRIPERSKTFVRELAGQGPIPDDLRVASSPQEAVTDADVICTATTSSTPVFDDADLKPGVHLNGIGAYRPDMQEVPAETVARARVVVDSRDAALAEAGDLIQPMQQGLITETHIHAELGELVLGRKQGRADADQISFFKSVGVAVQDAMAASVALKNAEALGLGQRVEW